MAHRQGHQTIGASLASFLGNLGQQQLAEGERSRGEQRAEDLRLRVRGERLGDIEAAETRADTRDLKRSQVSSLLSQFRAPTSQSEIDVSRNELQKLGIDTAPRTFTGPQSGRDFMEELRLKLESQERIARGRRKPTGERVDLPKQIDTTIKEFNVQRRNRQTGGKVDSASVRSARQLLNSVPSGVVDEPRLAKFVEEVEREESKQIADLKVEYNKGEGLGTFTDGFANPVDLEYFIELAARYPEDKRIQDIIADDDFPQEATEEIAILIAGGNGNVAQRPQNLVVPIRPAVTPRKNRFF